MTMEDRGLPSTTKLKKGGEGRLSFTQGLGKYLLPPAERAAGVLKSLCMKNLVPHIKMLAENCPIGGGNTDTRLRQGALIKRSKMYSGGVSTQDTNPSMVTAYDPGRTLLLYDYHDIAVRTAFVPVNPLSSPQRGQPEAYARDEAESQRRQPPQLPPATAGGLRRSGSWNSPRRGSPRSPRLQTSREQEDDHRRHYRRTERVPDRPRTQEPASYQRAREVTQRYRPRQSSRDEHWNDGQVNQEFRSHQERRKGPMIERANAQQLRLREHQRSASETSTSTGHHKTQPIPSRETTGGDRQGGGRGATLPPWRQSVPETEETAGELAKRINRRAITSEQPYNQSNVHVARYPISACTLIASTTDGWEQMCKRIMLDTGANAYGVVTDQFIKENNWPGVWLSRERGKAHSASSSIVVGGTYCTGFLLDQRTAVIARMMVIESSAPLCPLIGCDFVTALNANVRFGTGEMSILADAAKGERWVVKWEPYKGVLTRPLLRIPHDDTWKKYEVDEKLTILRVDVCMALSITSSA